jgi:hypothetical protein
VLCTVGGISSLRKFGEYVCEIWDNCGVCYSTKLEKLQLDAARIVTGLPIFTGYTQVFMARCYRDIVSIKCEIKIISNVCIGK